MTDNTAVDRIYCGDLTDLKHPVAPIIRVYIASTYTDMVLEKTELVNHIFPILKSYCKYMFGKQIFLKILTLFFQGQVWHRVPACGHEVGGEGRGD